MNIKTITSILVASTVAVSMAAVGYAANFPDVPESHWAYGYVNTLVEKGTVNGDENGNFNPDKRVTRAEMVKMVGKGTADTSYTDVDASHWGYDYIRTSGIAPDENGAFRPSEDMTRGDVVELLWQRAGSPTDCTAPENVKSAHKNSAAAAWGYQTGIMKGYENGEMGYENGITRAEAAAVIIRAGEAKPTEEKLGVKVLTDGTHEEVKIREDVGGINKNGFMYMLSEVPDEVYKSDIGKPAENIEKTFKFANDFDGLFTMVIGNTEKICKEQMKVDVKGTFYPSLVWKTPSTYKYIVKYDVISVNGQKLTYKDVFGGESTEPITDKTVVFTVIESDYAFGMGVGPVFNVSDPLFIGKAE